MKLKQLIRWMMWWISSFFVIQQDLSSIPYTILWKTVSWKDIQLYTFWSWDEHLLYIWWIHGNETGTVSLMHKWIYDLYHKSSSIPKHICVHIIPCLNADGYALAQQYPDYLSWGRIGKFNANKVDLNRNFLTSNWSADATMFIANQEYHVSWWLFPSSEPEVDCLLQFIKQQNIKTVYIYHNCRGTVMSDFSAYTNHLASEYAVKSWYKIFSEEQRNAWWDNKKTGHFTVWWQENSVSIVEVELATRWNAEWKRNKAALWHSLVV
jgi:hypothetical protein